MLVSITVLPFAILKFYHLINDVVILFMDFCKYLFISFQFGLQIFINTQSKIDNILKGFKHVIKKSEFFFDGPSLAEHKQDNFFQLF